MTFSVPPDRWAAVERERGTGTIRAHTGPHLLPCIWTECDRPARREHMHVMFEPTKNLFYFFCSGRHLQLWINSPRDMGNLATGSRGLLT